MWLLINNTREKIGNLKPLTIHLLLRYTEGIAFDLLKLGKASKMSGDLRTSPEIVVSLRKCSDDLRKYSGDLRKCSEVFGQSLENFGSILVIFGKFWKCSDDLRKCSEGFVWCSVIFGRLRTVFGRFRTIFGGLRNTSDIFVVICTRVSFSSLCYPFLHCVS